MPLYLDNNATTKPCEAAIEAADTLMRTAWHNPSSVHRQGQAARQHIELARQAVADLLGVKASTITFTAGATEAIDLAHRGIIEAAPPARRTIITTPTEHEAVRDICQALKRDAGATLLHLPLDSTGTVDPAALEALLDQHAEATALVSIQWANNETGVIQPVRDIARLCRARNVLFFSDATQWVGKMDARIAAPSPMGDIDIDGPLPAIDMLCLSSHKFHGIKGAGALYARRGIGLRPQILGAQEKGRRGGTEAAPAIAALGAAARETADWLGPTNDPNQTPPAAREAEQLRDHLERTLLAAHPNAVVNGAGAPHGRLWNTLNLGFPGLEAETILLYLSERGLAASAGAACSSGSLDPSPVLLAMGVPPTVAHGSIRLSLARDTTRADIDEAAALITEAVTALSNTAPMQRP
jgi:cysteine desulfurase